MVNPFKEVNWKPDNTAKRKFAVSLIIGFPCIALFFFLVGGLMHKGWNPAILYQVGGIGALAGVTFYVIPVLAGPVYLIWYAVACSIGLVVSNVLLVGMFYLVLTPIGLLLRVLGRDPMQKQPDKGAKSYWQPAEQTKDPRRYYRQY
jgi:hypothetical protein